MRDKKKLGLIGVLIFGGQFLFQLLQDNFFIETLIIAILFLFLFLYGVMKEKKEKGKPVSPSKKRR
ncbi:hypothetical protein H1D32_07780 [Anaerobacillus sp. CMMVII]|uniref:hypothetical protein n=1 Tax=Anaerobacillus sp. CMMVII TaxID=2755588 RepID=UPI0021B78C1B|nr:hypothetical protein [Anaerobacillus sp. CMMVII]MCT8137662.1 hypothetical protein [Anaerobacillus sp. CMMVII]